MKLYRNYLYFSIIINLLTLNLINRYKCILNLNFIHMSYYFYLKCQNNLLL